MNLKESNEGYMRGFGERKGKGKMMLIESKKLKEIVKTYFLANDATFISGGLNLFYIPTNSMKDCMFLFPLYVF